MNDAQQPKAEDQSSAPTKRICGAKKRSGGVCHRAPNASGKCHKHGGNGGGKIRHGLRSMALSRMGKFYVAALADRSLMNLSQPIAALRAICERLVERYDELDTGVFRSRVAKLLDEFEELARKGDSSMGAKLHEVQALVARGVEEDRVLIELRESFKVFCERVEAWHKIRLAKQEAINQRDALAVMAAFLDVVREHAPPDVANRITTGMERMLREQSLRN